MILTDGAILDVATVDLKLTALRPDPGCAGVVGGEQLDEREETVAGRLAEQVLDLASIALRDTRLDAQDVREQLHQDLTRVDHLPSDVVPRFREMKVPIGVFRDEALLLETLDADGRRPPS